MKAVDKRRADYVQPALPAVRVERMWQTMERARVERGRRVRRQRRVGLVAACLTVLLAVALRFGPRIRDAGRTIAAPGSEVVATADRGRDLALPDESVVSIAPFSRVALARADDREVGLRLDEGRILCEVTTRPGRTFVVQVDDVRIVVKGTRFSVERVAGDGGAAAVRVNVERGLVDVQDSRGEHVLVGAGDAWSSVVAPVAPAASAASGEVGDEEAGAPAELASARDAATRSPAETSARDLFQRGDGARIAGHLAQAAAAFEQLRRTYPSDARAGLAAFEAGRLRLSALDQPAAAADDLAFAAAHTEGTFREDAEAGRVEALERAGDTTACHRARKLFLERYPHSAHLAALAQICP